MHAGLFHTRNFAQMEGKTQFKSNSKQVPEDCCQRQNKATGTFLQVSSVQVYLIQRPHCSFFKHTSIQSAHTHTQRRQVRTHSNTMLHTHTSYCWRAVGERKIHYCDDWLCGGMGWPWAAVFSFNSKSEISRSGRIYEPIHSKQIPTLTYKSHTCCHVSMKHSKFSSVRKRQRCTAYTG